MKYIVLLFVMKFCLINVCYTQTLLIFGGENNKIFLGCLNCNQYQDDSIWNAYGDYGSSYSNKSIWNEYGDYGSEYSTSSPWNSYSSSPPIIVDREGNTYGYFTLNEYIGNRAEFELVLTIYKFHDLIREDVTKWFEKLFE